MSQLQMTETNQTIQTVTPMGIDNKTIIEHGNSPTAIILANAILISTLIASITALVRVILRKTD